MLVPMILQIPYIWNRLGSRPRRQKVGLMEEAMFHVSRHRKLWIFASSVVPGMSQASFVGALKPHCSKDGLLVSHNVKALHSAIELPVSSSSAGSVESGTIVSIDVELFTNSTPAGDLQRSHDEREQKLCPNETQGEWGN